MSATENKFILSNGMEVPCIGFGTYNAKGGDNLKMIKDAIEVFYGQFRLVVCTLIRSPSR